MTPKRFYDWQTDGGTDDVMRLVESHPELWNKLDANVARRDRKTGLIRTKPKEGFWPMTVKDIVEKRGNSRENLIQILHDIQDDSGDNSLHSEAIDELSKIMGIAVPDLLGTASFYTMFSLKPRGRHIIRVCESPPCYIMGEENILDAICDHLKVEVGSTTEDGAFTLETTSCLGACGVAPVISIDDEVYGNLTEDKVVGILDAIKAE